MTRQFLSPFERLSNLQRSLDANRGSDWLNRGISGGGSSPLLNVFQKDHDLVVTTELPGVKREDITVQVHDNRLQIAGSKDITYPEGTSLHRRERRSGQFDRTVSLPFEVDATKVTADFANGVLKITLPRAEKDRPQTIQIN